MMPDSKDRERNRRVGETVQQIVGKLLSYGWPHTAINEEIGRGINEVAAAAYKLGQQEIQPSQN